MTDRPSIEKPYFPCLLGNGVDTVLLDYSGSMSCDSGHLHTEQHQGVICAWYKATHRSVFASTPPLIQSTYTLLTAGGKTWYDAGGETYEVDEYDQQFDPGRGVLRTLVQASEFRLEVTSFITSGHVLVEHYRVLAAPSNGAIGLNLVPPGVHWSSGLYSFKAAMRHAFRADPEARTVRCSLEVGGVRGRAALYVDCPVSAEANYRGGKRLVVSDAIKPGAQFSKYVVLLDERDQVDYRLELDRILDELRSLGYEEVLQRHER